MSASVRVVDDWKTMYTVWMTESRGPHPMPAEVRKVLAAPERVRNPENRRWRLRHLRTDGSVYLEEWADPYQFARYFFPTEVEAWEGLLEIAQSSLTTYREGVERMEREVAELEQQVRFKRWQAGEAG